MIFLLCGNEPYLINEFKKNQIKSLDNPVCNYRMSYSCTQEDISFAQMVPFLSDRKMLALSLTDFTEAEALSAYLKSPADYTDVLITAVKLDKRGKLYNLFKSNGWIKEFNKVDDKTLQNFILSIIKKKNGCITEDAYQLLIKRLNYQGDENCSLFTVKTCVLQVLFFNHKITAETVDMIVDKTIEEDVFNLSSHLLKNERKEVFELVDLLLEHKQAPIGILSLLIRNFRIAFKTTLYKDINEAAKEIGIQAYQLKPYTGLNTNVIMYCLDLLEDAVRRIKTGYDGSKVLTLVLAMMLEKIE